MLRRWMKRWLKNEKSPRELFVHEDDWGQIEVLPAACRAWCAAEFARIGDFAAAHAAGGDGGWTDIYMRAEAPVTLASLHLPFAETITALAARLEAFDIVTSGTFSAPGPVARVAAFGPEAGVGVVVVPDRTGAMVDAMTLVLNGSESSCRAVTRAVTMISSAQPLLIVEWNRRALSLDA